MKKIGVILLLALILLAPLVYAQETNQETEAPQLPKPEIPDVEIPEWLQNVAQITFQVDRQIDFQELVILIALFAMLLLIIHNIVNMTPLFREGWQTWIGALVITALISITGAIHTMLNFLLGLANMFDILNKWGPAKTIFTILVIALIFYGTSIISKIIRHKLELEQAEEKGKDIAILEAKAKAVRRYSTK